MAKQQSKLGRNRTGLQMSPQDSQLLMETAADAADVDPQALAVIRGQYIAEAEPLGSIPIPIPGTVKGLVVTGAKLIQGKHPEFFMDKLAERLAFERGGTRLYEALITKYKASEQQDSGIALDALIDIRNDEAEHLRLLSECIESMGGDPTTQTPSADLVGVESMGLVQAVSDPRTTFSESLHAVLVAELTDVDAWGLLVSMAETMGNTDMASRFRTALEEENAHLANVRAWYQQLTLKAAS